MYELLLEVQLCSETGISSTQAVSTADCQFADIQTWNSSTYRTLCLGQTIVSAAIGMYRPHRPATIDRQHRCDGKTLDANVHWVALSSPCDHM